MAHTPTPILVLSAHIHDRHSQSAVDALVAGALDALPRPVSWTPERAAELHRAVHQISKVPVIRHPRGTAPRAAAPNRAHRPAASRSWPSPPRPADRTRSPTVLAGLQGLPATVLIVQHLHPDFTTGLVEWMARVSALPVQIATHNEIARPGRVYLAPGERPLTARTDPAPGAAYRTGDPAPSLR